MATMEGGLVGSGGSFTMGTLFLDRWTCIWHYGGTQYLGKKERLRKCKGSIRRIWRKDEHRNKKTREIRYSKGKGLQERRVTRKVYNKDVIQIGQQKVWGS